MEDLGSLVLRKILLADSAYITHFMLGRILRGEGYRIYYVKYPRDLVRQVRDISPDLLFLEPEISGGKGRQIVEYLARQVDLTIPIVLLTRITDTAKYDMLSWPGVHGLIRKPINSKKVLDVVAGIPYLDRSAENLGQTGELASS